VFFFTCCARANVIAHNPNGMPLLINEFMASNNASETDPQGQYDDWIEIYNYGVDALDIGGMYLTDDLAAPAKWRIPPVTLIEPGAYILIWADNDITDTGLHTNFKLDAKGEEIALLASDGVTVIDSVTFPNQTSDISYGRNAAATDDWCFFSTPTPGQENSDAYLGAVEALTFSHESGIHTQSFSVTIATETLDATIYYTLNGDDPLEMNLRGFPKGKVYAGPVLIDKSTCLRTQAIKPDWKPSVLAAQTYTFLAADVQDFSSNLPILIVETYGQTVQYSGNSDYRPSSVVVVQPDDSSGRALINGPSDFAGRGGFRVRGRSSSFLWPKMQYALEIWDQQSDDKAVSILGFPSESDWILVGPYSDKTLMRTVLPYQWSNEIGRYAARTQFVEMFLHIDGRVLSYDDYLGVYVFMEKIKRDENRVDIKELAPAHNDGPEVTGGYMLRKDWAESPHFDTVTGMELEYREPRAEEITEPQKAYIKGYMDDFETVLYGSEFRDPAEGYVKYIDVDSFIDYHLMTEMPKNGDGYYHSTFMFKDRGEKLQLGPIWDYNLSMGNFHSGSLSSPLGWYYPERSQNGTHRWFMRLFEDPDFRVKTADRWFDLRETVFSNAKLLADIDGYAALLHEAQARNFERWDTLGQSVDYNPSGWRDRDTYQKEVDWLKTWLEDRLAWMDQAIAHERAALPPVFQIDGIPHNADGAVQSDSTLRISSEQGTVYYTLDGSDPRLPGTPQSESLTYVLVPEEAEKKIFIPSASIGDAWKGSGLFNDRRWMPGAGAIGYDTGSSNRPLIDTDLYEHMNQGQTSCYTRIAFDHAIQNVNQFNIMMLMMRYDDGFVAYLNGVEVARANAPASPEWNSTATAQNPAGAATGLQAFDISAHLNVLDRGENILAIHGLNAGPDDTGFLISSQLVIEKRETDVDVAVSANAHAYTDPMTLTQSVTVKARALSDNGWSALNKASYAVGPVVESLFITKVIVPTPNDPEAGFIELMNVGTQTINLNLVKFTQGIDFTFPSIELAPLEHIVVVQNREAFQAKYGADLSIAGEYTGTLNPGDNLRLEDAIGRTIQDLPYQDD